MGLLSLKTQGKIWREKKRKKKEREKAKESKT